MKDKKLIYGKEQQVKDGDVVIIKGYERKRVLWRSGIRKTLIPDKDWPACAEQLRSGK